VKIATLFVKLWKHGAITKPTMLPWQDVDCNDENDDVDDDDVDAAAES